MAVQVTLNFTDSQAGRLQRAVGLDQQLGRDATGAEAKAWIITRVQNFVISSERFLATEAAKAQVLEPPPVDIT